MRPTTLSRAIALALGLAALSAPAAAQQRAFATPPAAAVSAAPSADPSAAWAGVYRVAITKGDETVHARVVMERDGEALAGTVLIEATASALTKLRHEGETLRATLLTSHGRGELALRATTDGVAGTLTVGKVTWTVEGKRSA